MKAPGRQMQYRTILAALEGHARLSPNKLFCRFLDGDRPQVVTYADLIRRSASFAGFLQMNGVSSEDTVVIIMPHHMGMIYSFFGAMMLGAVPTFMPFPSAKQDHATFWASHYKLLQLTGIRFILTYREIAAGVAQNFRGLDITILYVEDAELADSQLEPSQSITPGDIAFLQHSSGTTGLKKGVMLSHEAVLKQVYAYSSAIGFGSDDIIVSWLPLYHDMGLISCLMMTIIIGSTLVWMDPFEWVKRPSSLLDAIESNRGTFTFLPNFAFLHIARSVKAGQAWDLSSLRMAINCSEPCKSESFERFLEVLSRFGITRENLNVCYAMAENVFAVSQTRSDGRVSLELDINKLEVDHKIVAVADGDEGRVVMSCGRPINGTTIRIVDDHRAELPPGSAGEIAIQSEFLFSGYNRLPELTTEKLSGGWYYTGDLGFIHEEDLYVLGRRDDLMIIYGRNYYAHNVEEVVSSCDGVAPGRVVAFAVENQQMGTREAVVLLEANNDADPRELRRAVKKRIFDVLGLGVQHLEVVARNSLAKSTAGKISRDQNRRKFEKERMSSG